MKATPIPRGGKYVYLGRAQITLEAEGCGHFESRQPQFSAQVEMGYLYSFDFSDFWIL